MASHERTKWTGKTFFIWVWPVIHLPQHLYAERSIMLNIFKNLATTHRRIWLVAELLYNKSPAYAPNSLRVMSSLQVKDTNFLRQKDSRKCHVFISSGVVPSIVARFIAWVTTKLAGFSILTMNNTSGFLASACCIRCSTCERSRLTILQIKYYLFRIAFPQS